MLTELLLHRATAQKLHGVISHQDGIKEIRKNNLFFYE